jgi:hypothetical protein
MDPAYLHIPIDDQTEEDAAGEHKRPPAPEGLLLMGLLMIIVFRDHPVLVGLFCRASLSFFLMQSSSPLARFRMRNC